MKTAEQIAIEFGLCTCDEAYTKRKLTAPDCPMHGYGVVEAMQEYAKEALKDAAERTNKREYQSGIHKQLVLNLINELK